jgi:hypothetical protein
MMVETVFKCETIAQYMAQIVGTSKHEYAIKFVRHIENQHSLYTELSPMPGHEGISLEDAAEVRCVVSEIFSKESYKSYIEYKKKQIEGWKANPIDPKKLPELLEEMMDEYEADEQVCWEAANEIRRLQKLFGEK